MGSGIVIPAAFPVSHGLFPVITGQFPVNFRLFPIGFSVSFFSFQRAAAASTQPECGVRRNGKAT
jgi:hypothetical protein